MSQAMEPIRIAIGDNLWTRALVDGSVPVEGFPVEFHAKVTLPDRLHGVREGKWDGSDGTLTDYLLEKDAVLGVPKIALPIFMLGGFRQRTLLMRRGDKAQDLKGRKVLLPRVLTPGAVYMRGCSPTSSASAATRSSGTRFTAPRKMPIGHGSKAD